MHGWIEGFQRSLDLIESRLTEPLGIEEIAAAAALSPFYYQRIFGALCGMTVGEYVRARRMTLAAQQLACSDAKVIDVAMKYGYDSPDSFAKAFRSFHGVAPSYAREAGARLRSFAPLRIKITLEGGKMLNYKIEEMPEMTVVGFKRRFNEDTSYQEIPKFWGEWMNDTRGIMGMLGVCMDMDGKEFDYWIADMYDPAKPIPAGCETLRIPGGLWAQFECRGPLPESIQSVNTEIWAEWLPNLKGYELAFDCSIEVYMPPAEDPKDNLNYIWIPLKKV